MKSAWRKLGVGALLTVTILYSSACSSNRAAIYRAAAEQGRAQARVHLPPFPLECRTVIDHAKVAIGDAPVVLLKRERSKLDAANGVITRCHGLYEDLRKRLAD